MKTGTKSLLFGVHQFIWHPVTVLLAWHKLYGWPNWKELVCIIIHDWGYWNCEHIDNEKGQEHPLWAARKASKWFGWEYYNFCLYHSRHLAKHLEHEPSKLCWADKLSLLYEPWWLYIPRAKLSGELKEYRENAEKSGHLSINKTNREWLQWIKKYMTRMVIEKNSNVY